jgi:acetoin utilization deacetylase AcuC-like enzyme
MTIVYTDAHKAHQPPKEIYDGELADYAESAARADSIIGALREQKLGDIVSPEKFPIDHIYALHQRQYVDFLKMRSEGLGEGKVLYPSYFMSDTYAPITDGTYSAALAAVDAALTGAERVLGGENYVYTLCRPPGHHAGHHAMGGYCYFNNAAIAANYMSAKGKVAILDIDFHHGNGTQDAFYDRDDVLYVSLHADPTGNYPYSSGYEDEKGRGAGTGFNINYSLSLDTGNDQYLEVLAKALEDVQDFKPDFLVVSLGFDTFNEDPIAGLKLTLPVYADMGNMVRKLELPTLLVQEGGYNVEHLGEMAAGFLSSFADKV